MRIMVCDTPERLARHLADQWCRRVQERQGVFFAALSGGHTPRGQYERLASEEYRGKMPWDSLECFFSDERAVPPDHPDSNYGMFIRSLRGRASVAAHPMPAASGDDRLYEELLRQRVAAGPDRIPAFDLVFLGIGKDGHTASLFPGTQALEEVQRLVVMNEVPQLSTRRMTFSYPLINAAKRVWLMAAGPDKRDIISRCLAVRNQPGAWRSFPVLGVQPSPGELTWWLDQEAAAGLPPAADLDIQFITD